MFEYKFYAFRLNSFKCIGNTAFIYMIVPVILFSSSKRHNQAEIIKKSAILFWLSFGHACMSKIRNAGTSSLCLVLFGQRMSNSATMIKTI